MERKNKVARKVEAGIERNKLRFLNHWIFFTLFSLFNTQIMEFFFMLKVFYVVLE